MLGKCIKNEFVNRTKQAVGIICAAIGMAIFTRLVNIIVDGTSSSILGLFAGLINLAYVIVVIAAMVMTAFLPFLDFRQRFYKDQAYLTHTLPVKVSTMLVARMICDVVITTAISLAGVVSLIVAYGKNFYANALDFLENVISFLGNNSLKENSLLILLFVLFVIGVCFTTLNTIWLTNASYSFGHAFNRNKRLFSVIGLAVFYTVEMIFMTAVMYVCDSVGIMTSFEIDGVEDVTINILKSLCEMFVIMDIMAVLMVIAMGAVTNFICKRHLNVE